MYKTTVYTLVNARNYTSKTANIRTKVTLLSRHL